MPYQTKRQLREENARKNAILKAILDKSRHAGVSIEYSYGANKGASATVKPARNYILIEIAEYWADMRENRKLEAETATKRTLETVLNAFNIQTYRNWQTDGAHDTTRFLKDLETAIAVREAKRRADADAATERKVSGLVRKEPFHPGGYTGSIFYNYTTPSTAEQSARDIEDLKARLSGQTEKPEPKVPKKKGDKS